MPRMIVTSSNKNLSTEITMGWICRCPSPPLFDHCGNRSFLFRKRRIVQARFKTLERPQLCSDTYQGKD